jgi:hypothetical protein
MAAQVNRIAARYFWVSWLALIALVCTDRADAALNLRDFVILAAALAIASTSCTIAHQARKDGTQAVIKGLAAATQPPGEESRPDLYLAR